MDLNQFWFGMLGLLLAGYAVLDGFDLGVGVLYWFVRGDERRRHVLNSIGPVWDGNEVWLVTFGGALFAAFPPAYAELLSTMYLPFMTLLFCLIGRAISIEFRSKATHLFWRAYWDFSFALSSTLALFLMGTLVGYVLQGELTWYAPVVGLFAVVAAAMHGAFFLLLKLEDAQQLRAWAWRCFWLFLAMYVGVTTFALLQIPHALPRTPLAWVVVALNVLAIANIPRSLHFDRPGWGFVSSCAAIMTVTLLFGMAQYPYLLRPSLTAYNAASSQQTLALMRVIAFIGMPFVAAYTGVVYWVFRGKVRLDKSSY